MADFALSILRLVAGFLILCHGLQKVFGILGGHRAPLASLLGAAGLIETLGGVLILFGLFTRPTAFILCGEMAVAYFRAHAHRAPLPIQNGGELAVLDCFVFLYLIFAGAGAISVDRFVRGRS
ncbi:MAG: DoxX family protein [Acidobacteriaceae bacterium]|nr:DoxX family protein [Acidobacteriaceae bacterium]